MLDRWSWNATPEERAADYPCGKYIAGPYRSLFRALDIAAPASVVFRWLCQIKVAPYSYDWLDNRGRRSPRELTPGAAELAVGQRFQIFDLVEFEYDRQVTLVIRPEARRLFGPIALTYQVTPKGAASSRLVCRLDAGASSLPARARRAVLAAGDLVMMRKQLMTLRDLAERDAARR